MTSNDHKILEGVAKQILIKKGFKEKEIHIPYLIYTDESEKFEGRIRFMVDVAGVKKNKKVFVECGGCPQKRLEYLRYLADDVICLPYNFSNAFFNDPKLNLFKEENFVLRNLVQKLQKEICGLNNRIEEYEKQIFKAKRTIEKHNVLLGRLKDAVPSMNYLNTIISGFSEE